MPALHTYTRTLTIPISGTSGTVQLEDWDTFGLTFPTLDSTTIKIQVSTDNVTYYDVYDGNELQVLNWTTATTGARAVASRDMADVCGYPWMAVILGSAQNTAARSIVLCFKAPERT